MLPSIPPYLLALVITLLVASASANEEENLADLDSIPASMVVTKAFFKAITASADREECKRCNSFNLHDRILRLLFSSGKQKSQEEREKINARGVDELMESCRICANKCYTPFVRASQCDDLLKEAAILLALAASEPEEMGDDFVGPRSQKIAKRLARLREEKEKAAEEKESRKSEKQEEKEGKDKEKSGGKPTAKGTQAKTKGKATGDRTEL